MLTVATCCRSRGKLHLSDCAPPPPPPPPPALQITMHSRANHSLLWAMTATLLFFAGAVSAAVPGWAPTYNMSLSTAMMPCNYSGWMDVESTKGWGLIDLDWSNAKRLWSNARPMVGWQLSTLLSSSPHLTPLNPHPHPHHHPRTARNGL